MDYHSMKRRQLQALCKEHNIPANSANSVMANKLFQLLNEKQKPTTRQQTCLKSPFETPVDEKITDVVKEPEGNLGKVTRSKVHTLNKGAVAQLDETKQTKRGVKDVEKTNESVEGTFVGSVRVTRSKAQSLMGDGIGSDVNPQLKKRSGRRVAKDAHSVELSREITDTPVRITRTRGQILKEDIGNMVTNPEGEKKRTRREMKTTDLRINLSNVAPDDNQELPKRKSLRTRGVATADEDEAEKFGLGKQKKRSKESVAEVLESQHHADKGSRHLRRNMAKVEDSKVLKQNVSKVNRKVTRSQHQRESKLVQQAEEPSDHGEKKVVNRRKSVMQKAQGKGIDKPLVGKRESLKETVMVESPTRETVVPSTGNDVHEIPIFGESDNKEDIVSAGQGVAEHGELSTGNDVHEIPISGESDNKEDTVSAGQSVAEHGEMSTGVHEIPILGESDNKENMVTAGQSVAKHGELLTGKNVIYGFSIDRSDVADDVVDAGKDPIKKLEFEVVSSTGNDVHEVPILGKSDGEDKCANVTKEGEIDSMPSTDGDVLEDPVLSGSDGDDGGPNAIDCDTDSLPSTAANKLEDSVLSGNDGVDGSANATDCQIESLPSTSGNMIDDPVLSGSDSKAESKPKPLTDHDESDTSFLGKNDYINRQLEPTLELSPADDTIESPFSGNDIYDDVEADRGINVPKELETGLEPSNVPLSINDVSSDFENDQLPSNDGHAMDDHNVGGENSEPPPNENMPVVTEVSIRSCDQEPEHVFNVAADEVPCDAVGISASVGPFDSSTNIEASHTHGIAAITVGPLEESILDNKEAVSNILGDTYDTYTENGSGNERKFTELDEGVQPKESESFYPDMSKEQASEKAEMTTGIDNVLDDQEKHTVATVDLDLDGGKFLEDCSNHGVEEFDSELVGIINADENPMREENSPIVQTKEYSSQVMGDIGAHQSPITKGSSPITYTHEESPLDDTDSDSPAFFKEDDRNKQGSTTVDWGDYSFVMDEFHNPVTANESDDVLDKSRKVSEFQTSVGASSSDEENSRVAADMVNSVKNLEMASRNVANEKSSQEVDMLKENVNADMTEEVFNWSDSSLKSLLKTPAVTQLSHIKDGQEEGVSFSNQDHYSSLRYFFKTPATTRIGHVEYGQKDAVDFSNQDHCLSLKSLFTAPATARISHVKDDEENAGSFTFPDDRCNKDIAKNRPATHEFDHQWQMEPLGGFDGETQGNATTHSSENVMYVNIEDYSHKFFGDEVDDSSDDGSGKDKHFELKGDQVDQTKRFDLSSEAVGTSCYQASGVSDELEKKEKTKLKGSEPFDDLDFDKGI